MVNSDKSLILGSFAQGLRDGKGKHVFEEGTVYSGTWKEDRLQGEG